MELGLKVALLLRQLFPSSGATDTVFGTPFRTAVGTAIAWYTSCCAMPSGHCRTFCCSGGGPRYARSSGLAPAIEPSLSRPLLPLSPSLANILVSVDVMQNSSHSRTENRAQELCESPGGHPGLPSLISLRFLWT